MPFLLLERSALTYEELETIVQTHIPLFSVYEDTGRNREQQPTYPKNVGFVYNQSGLEKYVRAYKTFPELNDDIDKERPEDLTRKIQNAQTRFRADFVPAIGEWKARVSKCIKQCYAPYMLWAKKERVEEILKFLENGDDYYSEDLRF